MPTVQNAYNTSIAIVTGTNRFLGLHLSQFLISHNINTIGIPYILNEQTPLPSFLSNSNLFHLHSSQNNITSLKLHYKAESSISPKFDYIFLTDLFEASLSNQKLNQSQLAKLLKHQLNFLPFDSNHQTKITLILPYFNNQSSHSPFPFNHFHLPQFLQQLSQLKSSNQLNLRIVSIANCYGPFLKTNSPLPFYKIMSSIPNRKTTPVHASFQFRYSPLYISDAINGIFKATLNPNTINQNYLLSGSQTLTISTLTSQISQTIASKKFFSIKPTKLPLDLVIDLQQVKKTQTKLNWYPKIKFQEGLIKYLKWLNPQILQATAPEINPSFSKTFQQQILKILIFFTKPQKNFAYTFRFLKKSIQLSIAFWKSNQTSQKPSFRMAWKPLFLTSLFLFLTIPLTIFLFTASRGSFALYQSINNFRHNELELASENSLQASLYFNSLNKKVGKIPFLNKIPIVSNYQRRIQQHLEFAHTFSQSIYLSTHTLQLIEKTLISGLQTSTVQDPRIPLKQARLNLVKTRDNLAYLQSIMPDTMPIFLTKATQDIQFQQLKKLLPPVREFLSTALNVIDLYPALSGYSRPQTYLVIFQNNQEIRPTGGFIGSFGLISFDQGKLQDWKIYDTYDADEQLMGYVEPPQPIRDYLGEAGWYLRDANWDPNFSSTSKKIQWFLNKELPQPIDGVIAIDSDFIQQLVSELGNVQLQDSKQNITAGNFYLNAQRYPQSEFLPESHQKKDYLGSVADAILHKINSNNQLNWMKLASSINQSLQQKHVLIHFNDSSAQQLISGLGWSGELPESKNSNLPFSALENSNLLSNFNNSSQSSSKTDILPTTALLAEIEQKDSQNLSKPNSTYNLQNPQVLGATSMDTVSDSLYIVEANLGVNKVNQYLSRRIEHQVDLSHPQQLQEQLTLYYTNSSTNQSWSGGNYKNYIRLYLPLSTELQNIGIKTSDNSASDTSSTVNLNFDSIDITQEYGFTVYGFLVNIPPKTQIQVQINYKLPYPSLTSALPSPNHSNYKLNLIKQPGTNADAYKLIVKYPANYRPTNSLVSSRFNQWGTKADQSATKSLTSSQSLQYNLNLVTDKFISISFTKEKIKSL